MFTVNLWRKKWSHQQCEHFPLVLERVSYATDVSFFGQVITQPNLRPIANIKKRDRFTCPFISTEHQIYISLPLIFFWLIVSLFFLNFILCVSLTTSTNPFKMRWGSSNAIHRLRMSYPETASCSLSKESIIFRSFFFSLLYCHIYGKNDTSYL